MKATKVENQTIYSSVSRLLFEVISR